MWKRCTCFAFLIVLIALIQGGAAYGFDALTDPALVAWWSFDEGTGTTAADSSPNGNDGTLTGGVSWVPGRFGNAIQLDGTSGYVSVPNFQLTTGTITFVTWVNGWKGGDWAPLLSSRAVNACEMNFGDNNTLHYTWNGDSSATWGWAGGPTIPQDSWAMLAVTIAADKAVAYVYTDDGGLTQATNAIAHIEQTVGALQIGYSYDPRYVRGILDEAAIYSRALTEEEILILTKGPKDPTLASSPVPGNEATDVPRDTALSWAPGKFAATHDVYFGTAFENVDAATRANPMGVLVSQGQTATTYDPGRLEFGQTYYWRIDEVNAAPDNTIFKGDVWTFGVEPFAYAVPNIIATSNGSSDEASGPENTVNGSGLNASDQHSVEADDMWVTLPPADGSALYIQYEFDGVYKLYELQVWNYNVMFEKLLGFGLKNVTVEYSTDGAEWTALGDFDLNQATAKSTYVYNSTIDFQGLAVKYVKLTVNSGFGMMGQFGLSEVRFMYLPVQAREPQPADGAAGVEVGKVMTWRSGREAASHQVFLGTDPNALTLAGTTDSASFAPALEFGSTYYWQIVEVNEAEAISTWAGDQWSFATQEYAMIDGFETYTDDIEAGMAIFDTWLDGWVNNNGSTVGYFNAPFAEKTIIHSGSQSMPLQYDNSVSPFYSEAEREFETAQNWTGNAADTLVLYVQGAAPAFAEAANGSIIMNAIGTDIWDVADQFRYAYKSLSGNGSITVRVDSVVRSNEWAKAGVMIRETLEAGSKHAFVAVTPEPTHGVSFQRRPATDLASANTDVADIAMPHWVKLTRTGNTFTAQQSADGVTWTDIVVSPALTIEMTSNVYIGLAVTSHAAAIVTAAEFSNVSTTGNVTGAWQTAEIGVAQPEGNSAESMYATIEDSTGKTKTVTNADAAITQRPTWQEWAIPYSDLSGVNLSRVQKMIIGVGSKSSPKAGGTGIVYIDDIGFGHEMVP